MLPITPHINLGYWLIALGFAACLAMAMVARRCFGEAEAANDEFADDWEVTNVLTKLTRTRPGYRLNQLSLGASVAAAMAAQRCRARRHDDGPVARAW